MIDRKPTTHDRCTGCGDPIDPRNYGRDRNGFMCEPCDDAGHSYSTTAHDADTAS